MHVDPEKHYRQQGKEMAQRFILTVIEFLDQHGLKEMTVEEALANEQLMLAMTKWLILGKPSKE